MTYDFSHMYRTEVIQIAPEFTVTVREITHGEYAAIQEEFMGHLTRSHKGTGYELEKKRISAVSFQERKSLLGIAEWSLKTKDGEPVPVCIEAWSALPHHVTEVIEAAIERLNPDLDEEFPGESGNGSESQSTGEDTA